MNHVLIYSTGTFEKKPRKGFLSRATITSLTSVKCRFINAKIRLVIKPTLYQPRPQGHLCGRGEEIDDPGKGCSNLLVHWLTHSTSQGL